MTEVDAIKSDLQALKTEVRDELSGMRSDLKDLAKALHELIRLGGDLGRVADLANRIGKEVDQLATRVRDDKEKTDGRLQALEIAQAGNAKSVGLFDKLVTHGLSLIVGGILVALAHTQGVFG
jgi:hypothetical protein